MYSAPFALIAIAAMLARLPQGRFARKVLLALAIFNAVPVLAFVLYGSPVFPSRGYWALLMQVGPGNYTLTKLYEAGLLKYPFLAWLGAALIGGLLIFWRRAAGRLIDHWSASSAMVDRPPVSGIADRS
jgi:hypothetical protein